MPIDSADLRTVLRRHIGHAGDGNSTCTGRFRLCHRCDFLMRCSAPGLVFCPRLRFAPPRFVLRRCKYLRPVSRWSYGPRHFQRSRQHALPQCVSQCASCALIIVCSYAGDWKQDALAAPIWAGRELHTVVQLKWPAGSDGGSSNCYDCGASPLNDIWVSSTFGGEEQALRVYGPDCYVQPPGSQSAHWPVTGLGLLATATRLWL